MPREYDSEVEHLAIDALRSALSSFRSRTRGQRPVWESPEDVADLLRGALGSLPDEGQELVDTLGFLVTSVLERPVGNTDPRFFGWVHGGGDELGIIAAVLVSAMNANTGGRDHGAVHIEQVVLGWMREIFGFSRASTSVFTQGTSEANLLALATARTSARRRVPGPHDPHREVIYVSPEAHESIWKAARVLQFGHVRVLPDCSTDRVGLIDVATLERSITRDRDAGLFPVCIVGTAGTVDRGATDDLEGLASVAATTGVWLHVDGAFGAWLRIAPWPFNQPVLGIERSDSLAFDLHKWLPVPFATGVLLVADGSVHRETFAASAGYLERAQALAGGPDWAANYGIALSRPFQGLAAYLILRTHGLRALGQHVAYCVVLAHYMGDLIDRTPGLRLVAPVCGNVVLFEVLDAEKRPLPADWFASQLQSKGRTVLSTTSFNGRRVLRACFVNHRTRPRHLEAAISEILEERLHPSNH